MVKLKKDVIVYKGAYTSREAPCLVTLKLTKGTRVRCALFHKNSYDKNRADKAKVLKINRIEIKGWNTFARKETIKGKVRSWKSYNFQYKVGDIIKPEYPFDLSNEVCASGIHFYMNKERAIAFIC